MCYMCMRVGTCITVCAFVLESERVFVCVGEIQKFAGGPPASRPRLIMRVRKLRERAGGGSSPIEPRNIANALS